MEAELGPSQQIPKEKATDANRPIGFVSNFLLILPHALQLQLEKVKGEILGVVIVESGWGSILPTVILANMMNGGPAARSGKLSIGDQIMSINNTSLVGLPLATCQGIIKVQRL